jgi:hypothetical protein
MRKLRDMHYELLEHPPYSPDLVPSDFCLFPKLKLFLAGQRFSSNQSDRTSKEFDVLTAAFWRIPVSPLFLAG